MTTTPKPCTMPEEDVICPFCKDTGFDIIGLKRHLDYYCETFDNMPNDWELGKAEDV